MSMQSHFIDTAAPISRLLGHSLAVMIGFVGFAAISLVPVGVLKVIVLLGAEHLAHLLEPVETAIVLADIGLFGLIFVNGIVVFVVEEVMTTIRTIRRILKDGKNE